VLCKDPGLGPVPDDVGRDCAGAALRKDLDSCSRRDGQMRVRDIFTGAIGVHGAPGDPVEGVFRDLFPVNFLQITPLYSSCAGAGR
jgi:hypothetical protein